MAFKIPILMYHHVSQVPSNLRSDSLAHLYIKPQDFDKQMWLLKRLGFQGLSMSDAKPYLNNKKKGKVAVITLDDGFVDNVENGLPILKKYGFTATCYALSGVSYNTWDEKKSGLQEPLMNYNQLRQWLKEGMEIGAHTRTHPKLTGCDKTALYEQIHVCKQELEDILKTKITQFAYPYGDYNNEVIEVVRKAGFSDAVTTVKKRATAGADRFTWPRIRVKNRHSIFKIGLRLLTGI